MMRTALLFSLCLAIVFTPAAFAVQFEDNFTNAAYDGSINDTLWAVDIESATGTDVYQRGSDDTLVIDTAARPDGNYTGIFSKNLLQFNSANRDQGTNIEIIVDQINITADSGQWRDLNFMIFLTDATTPGHFNHWSYPDASLVFYQDIKGNNTVNGVTYWTKMDAQGNNNGWWHGDRNDLGNLTFPLKINLVINDAYVELSYNDQPFFVSSTINAAHYTNGACLRLMVENQGPGRGNVVISRITVGDAGATPFPHVPTTLTPSGITTSFGPDAYDGGLNPNHFYLAGAGPWAQPPWGIAAQNAGILSVTAPNAQFEETVVGTGSLPVSPGQEVEVKFDILSYEMLDGDAQGNCTLSIMEGPYSFAYYHSSMAALNIAMIKPGEATDELRVLIFRKPRGNSFWQGVKIYDSNDFGGNKVVTFPLEVRLVLSHTDYQLYFNNDLVDTLSHTVDFGNWMSAHISARNEGNPSRTRVNFDNFSFKVLTSVDDWQNY